MAGQHMAVFFDISSVEGLDESDPASFTLAGQRAGLPPARGLHAAELHAPG